jgi:tetratricopeptide (TPR) repeat protein
MHLVFMLGYHLFGPVPWGYHLINILLNMAVCVAVFAVTGRLLKDAGYDTGAATYVPLISAVLFAVHPVHTEAVAWVAAVPELTYALFFLLSLYFYMLSRSGARRAGWAVSASVAFFFAALLSKEPAVTLPAVFFAYDYVVKKCKDNTASYLKRYMPYAAALAVYFVLRFAALGSFSPNTPAWKFGPLQIAVNIPSLLGQYVEMALFPLNMNVSHVFDPVTFIPSLPAVIAALFAVAFAAALFVSFRKRSLSAMGLVLFAVPLLPSMYIPALGSNVFCDRYMYLPIAGYALLAGLFYVRVTKLMPGHGKAFAALVVGVAAVYSLITINANKVWANDIALWEHSVSLSPYNSTAHGSLGQSYVKNGLVDKGIEEYKMSLALNKDFLMPHVGLAGAYVKKGMLDKATEESNYVLSNAGESRYLKSVAHGSFGAIYAKQGRLDKAKEEFLLAIELNPLLPEAYSNLGAVYGMQGQLDQALENCRIAVDIAPDYLELHNNLGIIYSMMGKNEEAIDEFNFVLMKNPFYPKGHNNLGITYARMGHTDMAIREFEEALKADPEDSLLRKNLMRARETGPQPPQGP